MEKRKPKYLITQSSLTGQLNSNDWVNIAKKNVPADASDLEILRELTIGTVSRIKGPNGEYLFLRMVSLEINRNTAAEIVATHFNNHLLEIREGKLQNDSAIRGLKLPPEFRSLEWNFVAIMMATLFEADIASDSASAFAIEKRLKRLYAAAATDRIIYNQLLEVVAALLRENRSLPRSLSRWISDHLTGQRICPRKHGSAKSKNLYRNLEIALAVLMLQEGGILATRNDEKRAEKLSGCDIVANVLTTKFGISMTYSNVKKIWNDCKADPITYEGVNLAWENLQVQTFHTT